MKLMKFIDDKAQKVDNFFIERERKTQERQATRKLKEKLDRGTLSMEAKEAKEELKELKLAEKDRKVLEEVRAFKQSNKKPFIDLGNVGNKLDNVIDFEGYQKRTDKMFDTSDMFKQNKKKKGDDGWLP